MKNATKTEWPKADWFTIQVTGRAVRSGKLQTEFGEVRIRIGGYGKPGGRLYSTPCVSFKLWFEGWEWYAEIPFVDEETEKTWEDSCRGFAATIGRGYASDGGSCTKQ